jgi:hypothetical protein
MKTPLLLHICCAPDMAWGLTVLRDHYDIRCFFCNPNICPLGEYAKRLDESYKVAKIFDTPLEADDDDPALWERTISGAEQTSEQGERCRRCFALRLERSALYSRDRGIESLSTVMSVSPHKRIEMIDHAGRAAALKHGISFLSINLKKDDGFRKSVLLSEELGIYRQDYCGCRLSLVERDQRKSAAHSGYSSAAPTTIP